MSLSNNSKARRKLIMARYLKPKYYGQVKGAQVVRKFANHCDDKLEITFLWNNKILKVSKHISTGCSIFVSATDLMIEKIISKNIAQIKLLISNFLAMLYQKNVYNQKLLGKLIVFQKLGLQPNRIECALIVCKAIKTAIKSLKIV